MSNTRIAEPGAPFKQGRYSSAPEFSQGLLANLVAKKCALVEDKQIREILWFLQAMSHQNGSLEKFAQDMKTTFPGRIGTPSMHKIGMKAGAYYSAAQVKAIREEMALGEAAEFELEGDITYRDLMDEMSSTQTSRLRKPYPDGYPVSRLVDRCECASERLADYLREVCLDPALKFDVLEHWYWPTLKECLCEYMKSYAENRLKSVVATKIAAKVIEELEYALYGKCLVMISGLARMGKSWSARGWCEANPGKARYLEVPSSNDDASLFREIARSLGISARYTMKCHELSERIGDSLGNGDLLLVLDEGHRLFGQHTRLSDATPRRLNWVMSALLNKNVPVVILTSPQFTVNLRAVEKSTLWASEQFRGRISHFEELPDTLPQDDLRAVAHFLLPDGDKKAIALLVDYARSEANYLAGIEQVVKRSGHLAQKQGRTTISTSDVARAVRVCLASSMSQSRALGTLKRAPAQRGVLTSREPARPLQRADKPFERGFPGGLETVRETAHEAALVTA